VRTCPLCGSRFEDHSPWGGPEWVLANLDGSLPGADLTFGRPVKWALPWPAEGQAHELSIRLVNCLNRIDGRGRFFADTSGHIGQMRKRRGVTCLLLTGRQTVWKSGAAVSYD
jgi:hypothetical protein